MRNSAWNVQAGIFSNPRKLSLHWNTTSPHRQWFGALDHTFVDAEVGLAAGYVHVMFFAGFELSLLCTCSS